MDEISIDLPPTADQPGYVLLIQGHPKGNEADRIAWYCEKCTALVYMSELVTRHPRLQGFLELGAPGGARIQRRTETAHLSGIAATSIRSAMPPSPPTTRRRSGRRASNGDGRAGSVFRFRRHGGRRGPGSGTAITRSGRAARSATSRPMCCTNGPSKRRPPVSDQRRRSRVFHRVPRGHALSHLASLRLLGRERCRRDAAHRPSAGESRILHAGGRRAHRQTGRGELSLSFARNARRASARRRFAEVQSGYERLHRLRA